MDGHVSVYSCNTVWGELMRAVSFVLSLFAVFYLWQFHYQCLMSDHYYLVAITADTKALFPISFDAAAKGAEIDPNKPSFYAFMGTGFRRVGKYKDAIFCYNKMINLYPWHLNTLINLAVCNTNIGNAAEMNKYADRVIKIKPSYERKGAR